MEHCIPFAVFSGSTAPAEPSPTKPGPEAVAAASPKARGPLADIKREAAKQQRNSSTSSRLGSMFVEESRAPAGTNGGDSGDDGEEGKADWRQCVTSPFRLLLRSTDQEVPTNTPH